MCGNITNDAIKMNETLLIINVDLMNTVYLHGKKISSAYVSCAELGVFHTFYGLYILCDTGIDHFFLALIAYQIFFYAAPNV